MQFVSASDFESQNQQKMDEALLVRFYNKSVEDRIESRKAGRPIFVDKEYIEIRVPGSRDAVARPANQADINRFPRHYEAFKRRTEAPHEGTPLTEWPLISRSMADELAFFNVKTVEQLVAMSDQNASQFMGINKLKEDAKKWLEAAAGENAEIEELKTKLAERDEQLAALAERLEKLEAAATPAPAKKAPARKKTTAKRKKVTAKKE